MSNVAELDYVTLNLPGNTPLPVPFDDRGPRWRRVGNAIVVTYTREELEWALDVMRASTMLKGIGVQACTTQLTMTKLSD